MPKTVIPSTARTPTPGAEAAEPSATANAASLTSCATTRSNRAPPPATPSAPAVELASASDAPIECPLQSARHCVSSERASSSQLSASSGRIGLFSSPSNRSSQQRNASSRSASGTPRPSGAPPVLTRCNALICTLKSYAARTASILLAGTVSPSTHVWIYQNHGYPAPGRPSPTGTGTSIGSDAESFGPADTVRATHQPPAHPGAS